jgi:hypothetical protein
MSYGENIRVGLDRAAAGRRGSAAWQLGLPPRPYIWRRNDPDREAKIAAERADTAQKQAAAQARARRHRKPFP